MAANMQLTLNKGLHFRNTSSDRSGATRLADLKVGRVVLIPFLVCLQLTPLWARSVNKKCVALPKSALTG